MISSALGILLQLLRHHRRERPEAGDGGASRGLIPGKVFRDTPLAPVAEEDFGRRGLPEGCFQGIPDGLSRLRVFRHFKGVAQALWTRLAEPSAADGGGSLRV